MFDPYHKWLGIPLRDQPPNHYRLLHLDLYESDLDVIEGAADRAMGFIRQYQSGEHAALAAKLLNEVASARLCLLKPDSKAQYDAKLKKETAVPAPAEPKIDPVSDQIESLPAERETPRRLAPAPRPKKSRTKRKNAKLSQQLLVGGGIGAVVVVVLIVALSSRTNQPQPNPATTNTDIAKSNPATSVAAPPVVSPSVSTPESFPKPATSTAAGPKGERPETTHHAEPSGPEINLLSNVDITRDKLAGDCKKEGTSLICGPAAKMYLPARVPDDYQLKLRVKRISGTGGFAVGLVTAGQQTAASFDAYASKISGLYVDGLEPNGNYTTRQGALLENDRLSKVEITVHPNHIFASVDGKIVIDWQGDSRRLSWNAVHAMPSRESPSVFVATDATIQIESAAMIPVNPEPPRKRIARLDRTIDVLPLLDMNVDAVQGAWTINKNTLHSPESYSQLMIPAAVPDEFTLSATVEFPSQTRREGNLVFGLTAGGEFFSMVAVDPQCLGIDLIDGARYHSNETRVDGVSLTPGKTGKLACTVSKGRVRLEIDGRTVIDWRGDFRRLASHPDWTIADNRRLLLGTNAHFKLSDIKLGPLIDPPDLPAHPALQIGRSFDLLEIVDPARDGLSGSWTKAAGQLTSPGDVGHPLLDIPCEIPTDYKLSLRVAREAGGKQNDGHLAIGLPTATCNASLYIDVYASTVTALAIDRTDLKDNETTYRQPVIPPGPAVDIECSVRKTGIKVTSGGKTMIDWTGNLERSSLVADDSEPGPGRRLSLSGPWQRFRFEKIQIEPLEPEHFPIVSNVPQSGMLMSVIVPPRDSRVGTWKSDGSELISPQLKNARLRIPVPVPEKYLFSATVERRKGDDEMNIGLVVGGNSCAVAIDGDQCSVAGLNSLDGRTFSDAANLTRRAYATPALPVGQPVAIKCLVLRDTIVVKCGDREIIRWHGDARRLSIGTESLPPNPTAEDREQLWLGAMESEFAIRELKLKPLDETEAAEMTSQFTGVFPIKTRTDVEAEVGVSFDEVTSDKPVKGETYLIVSTDSGRCLSVKDSVIVTGPFAHAAGPVERWKLLASGKDIKIMNEKSGKVIDVLGNSGAGNATLIEYQDSNTDNERWEFLPIGKHWYIRSRSSGLVIAVAGSIKTLNARVIQWPASKAADLIWRLQKVSRSPKK